ncbi:hypothetical protein ACFLYU_05285, partial [Candidatus Dependentiae bacterium]
KKENQMKNNFYKVVSITICFLVSITFANKANAMKKGVLAFGSEDGKVRILDFSRFTVKSSDPTLDISEIKSLKTLEVKTKDKTPKKTGVLTARYLQFNPKKPRFLLFLKDTGIKKDIDEDKDHEIIIWDLDKNKPIKILKGYWNYVAYNPENPRFLFTIADDTKTIEIFDPRTESKHIKTSKERIKTSKKRINFIAVNLKKPNIIAACDTEAYMGSTKSIVIINTKLKRVAGNINKKIRPNTLAFSPDGKYLVSGDHDGKIRVFDLNNKNKLIETLEGHSTDTDTKEPSIIVRSLKFSPKKPNIFISCSSRTVRVWDLNKKGKKCIRTLKGNDPDFPYNLNILAIDPRDPNIVATTNYNDEIIIWDISKPKGKEKIMTLYGEKLGTLITSLAFQPSLEKTEKVIMQKMLFEQQKAGSAEAKLIDMYKKGKITKPELERKRREIKEEYRTGEVRIRKGLKPYTQYKL